MSGGDDSKEKMGKSGKKKSSLSSSSSSPSNDGRYFFKVYLPSDSSQRLKIPKTFLNNINGDLPEVINLRDSCGGIWPMEVKKIEEDFFFLIGWQAFARYRSLNLGEFLVFKYDGNLTFEVKIYDYSGCEKEETSEEEESTVAIKKSSSDSKQKHSRIRKKVGKSGAYSRTVRLNGKDYNSWLKRKVLPDIDMS